MLKPFTFRAAKTDLRILKYITYQSIIWKTFEGEMIIRSQTTTLLQICYELSPYLQVIFKSMRVADDTF